jgi:Calx-beta domain-containing protein
VAVRGDAVIEPDEALSVTVGDASATLTIEDDEPLALSVASPKAGEGEAATFTVALDEAGTSSVSVDYEVKGVTANVPADVAAGSGTLVFAAGETTKQVTVQVKQDTEVEGDEAFRLALSNIEADRPVLRGESTVATIVDDDESSPADTVAPVTTASAVPPGWSRQSVTVSLNATDEGSGVKEIAYRIGTTTKTVAGATASIPVTAEGTTTIAYRAKDNAGNLEAEKTLVVRIDKTAPTVSCTAKPGTLLPADNKLVPITVTVKVTDGRSGPAGFSLVSVTSNEPADGDIRDFVTGTADVAGQLRAERSDKGHGRVYTLKYVGRDAAGNERTCTTTVTVPRGCSAARAARARKEVRKARRHAARRRR